MAWGAIASAIAPAAISAVGGMLQNNQNRQIAADNNAFTERMSSSAMQRQKADYEAAGINPLLGLGTGASTPAGAGAQMENVLAGGAASAMEGFRLSNETKKMKAEVDNLEKTNKLIKSQTNKADMETHVLSRGIPEADTKNMLFNKARPMLEKLLDSFSTSSSKSSERQTLERSREAVKAFEKMTNKKVKMKGKN